MTQFRPSLLHLWLSETTSLMPLTYCLRYQRATLQESGRENVMGLGHCCWQAPHLRKGWRTCQSKSKVWSRQRVRRRKNEKIEKKHTEQKKKNKKKKKKKKKKTWRHAERISQGVGSQNADRPIRPSTNHVKLKGSNINDIDRECLICGEIFSKSRPKEQWIKCLECGGWCHYDCTSGESSRGFVCEFCH